MTTLPTLTAYAGVVPNKETQSKDVFGGAVYSYLGYFSATFTPEMIAYRTALSTLSGEIATQATSAQSSASSASTSAQTATAQAGLATTNGANQVALATAQVGLATTAKTAAQTAQAAAEAAVDSFDDRYLGSKSADPTVDNDGNPLTMGAMYYYTNTDPALNKLRVYDSALTIWTNMSFVPTSHTGLSGIGTMTHTQLEAAIALKANQTTTYTKVEVDSALASKPSGDTIYSNFNYGGF